MDEKLITRDVELKDLQIFFTNAVAREHSFVVGLMVRKTKWHCGNCFEAHPTALRSAPQQGGLHGCVLGGVNLRILRR